VVGANLSNVALKDGDIETLIAAFEAAARKDREGREFWFARELQKLLGYDRWENFLSAVNRAKAACENSGQPVVDHFRDVTKMIELGKGAVRDIEDIKLGRYACYLITQNSDARKKPVAFGQGYFAIQTRRQEIADQEALPPSEDGKRVLLRNQIKEHNRYLSGAAKAPFRAGLFFRSWLKVAKPPWPIASRPGF
jgi:DNA-damage-inducible protein D